MIVEAWTTIESLPCYLWRVDVPLITVTEKDSLRGLLRYVVTHLRNQVGPHAKFRIVTSMLEVSQNLNAYDMMAMSLPGEPFGFGRAVLSIHQHLGVDEVLFTADPTAKPEVE